MNKRTETCRWVVRTSGAYRCGVELGRRVREQELFGLNVAAVTTGFRRQMGKTGAVPRLNSEAAVGYGLLAIRSNTEDGDVGGSFRSSLTCRWLKCPSEQCRVRHQ